ncbi:hypothetical protein KSAC_32470 (plasmid) [Komagataeibacter saccharivorans]|nr:hypothetical protein KSAC_32470 [Komagataeibacter saccharivorans]
MCSVWALYYEIEWVMFPVIFIFFFSICDLNIPFHTLSKYESACPEHFFI